MYVQTITFSLAGISEEEYLDVANQLAARLASAPGLLAKVWLENEGGNRYGGIYFWDDLESMQRFGESDLFEGRVPQFADAVVEEFSVLENLTRQTQPVLEVLEPKATGIAAAAGQAAAPSAAPPAVGPPAAQKKRTPPPRKAGAKASATTKATTTTKAPTSKAASSKAATTGTPAKKATARKVTG